MCVRAYHGKPIAATTKPTTDRTSGDACRTAAGRRWHVCRLYSSFVGHRTRSADMDYISCMHMQCAPAQLIVYPCVRTRHILHRQRPTSMQNCSLLAMYMLGFEWYFFCLFHPAVCVCVCVNENHGGIYAISVPAEIASNKQPPFYMQMACIFDAFGSILCDNLSFSLTMQFMHCTLGRVFAFRLDICRGWRGWFIKWQRHSIQLWLSKLAFIRFEWRVMTWRRCTFCNNLITHGYSCRVAVLLFMLCSSVRRYDRIEI